MAGINKVILIGNLGKDPEVRHLEGGTPVANFSLATTENYKDRTSGEWKSTTEWHRIVVWRGLAERAEKLLKKGSQIYVEGKLRTRSWEDKDGKTNYSTEVVGDRIMMMGKREDSDQQSPAPVSEPQTSSSSQDDSDDLPF